MRINNPYRKWWQFWKPKYIDLAKHDKKRKFPLGSKIEHGGRTYVYFKQV